MLPEIYKVRQKYRVSDGNGGASQGRSGRGSLRFRTNDPVENVPFSTTGLCLEEGRRGRGRTRFARETF